MSVITTHVLDTGLGRPAVGVRVRLESVSGAGSGTDGTPQITVVAEGTTNGDGRVPDLGPDQLRPGTYRLVFDVAAYAAESGQSCFFPEVSITFTLPDAGDGTVEHHHVPLLLSPFSYSTYRGS